VITLIERLFDSLVGLLLLLTRAPQPDQANHSTDWTGILIPTIAGLVGAGVGGAATWKAGTKMSNDARDLAKEERDQEREQRADQIAADAARALRAVVVDAQLRFANIAEANAQGWTELAQGTKDAHRSLQVAILTQGYLMPPNVQDRLDRFYELMARGMYANEHIDHGSRATNTLRRYAQFLKLTLEAVQAKTPIPADVEPPNPTFPADPWLPDPLPAGWREDR